MEPKRYLFEGPTLREVQERILAVHGKDATIIAAERVTVGGIRGFFARQHYEVIVEVIESATRRRSAHAGLDMTARLGIAALLADADEEESQLHRVDTAPRLSTDSDGFAALMDELTFATARAPVDLVVPAADPVPGAATAYEAGSTRAATGAATGAADVGVGTLRASGGTRFGAQRFAPTPLTRPGDLVLVVGLVDDALTIARLMLRLAGSGDLRISGALLHGSPERVDDRREALAARARGVELGHSTFIAFGLEPASDVVARAVTFAALDADQVWVVVDAGRKPEDTKRWVNMVAGAVSVDAVAAIGAQLTTSPATVTELDLPVEWMDGRDAAAPTGRRAASRRA
ncbi:MAG: hypothetical protein LH475_07555 [Cryobacterium sp.]|uniref:hypothetical protein n=1 Tax=unclassified Cryobacterium TaxID=2649013 RepID=UPI0018CB3025|nr:MULTISPECIES: hypothetical protein [unclassified Cryobacterium]MCY7404466.1 hypothetical protein [Cryobacterium sp.]